MKYKVGDTILLEAKIVDVYDGAPRPFYVDFDDSDCRVWVARDCVLALVSRKKQEKPKDGPSWFSANVTPISTRNVQVKRADETIGYGFHASEWYWLGKKFRAVMRNPIYGGNKNRVIFESDPNPIVAWRELPAED